MAPGDAHPYLAPFCLGKIPAIEEVRPSVGRTFLKLGGMRETMIEQYLK